MAEHNPRFVRNTASANIYFIYTDCRRLRSIFHSLRDNLQEQNKCLEEIRTHAMNFTTILKTEAQAVQNIDFGLMAKIAFMLSYWHEVHGMKEAVVAIAHWLISRLHYPEMYPTCTTHTLSEFATAFSKWRNLTGDENPSLRRATGAIAEIFETKKEEASDFNSLHRLSWSFNVWGKQDTFMFKGMVAIASNIITQYMYMYLYHIDPDSLANLVYGFSMWIVEGKFHPLLRMAILSVAKQIYIYYENSQLRKFNPDQLNKLMTSFSGKNLQDDDHKSLKRAMTAIAELIYEDYKSNGLQHYEIKELCHMLRFLGNWSYHRDIIMKRTAFSIAKILILKRSVFLISPGSEYLLSEIAIGCNKWYSTHDYDDNEEKTLRELAIHIATYIEGCPPESLDSFTAKELSCICFNFKNWFCDDTQLKTLRKATLRIAELVIKHDQENNLKMYNSENTCIWKLVYSFNKFQDDEKDTLMQSTAVLAQCYTYQLSTNLTYEHNIICKLLEGYSRWCKKDVPSLRKGVHAIAKLIIEQYEGRRLIHFYTDILLKIIEYLSKWRNKDNSEKSLFRAILSMANSIILRYQDKEDFRDLVPYKYSKLSYSFVKWVTAEDIEESIEGVILKVAKTVINGNIHNYSTHDLARLAFSFSKMAQFVEDSALIAGSNKIVLGFLAADGYRRINTKYSKNISIFANAFDTWFLLRSGYNIKNLKTSNLAIAYIINREYNCNRLVLYKTKHLANIGHSFIPWFNSDGKGVRRNALFAIANVFITSNERHSLYPKEMSNLAEAFGKWICRDNAEQSLCTAILAIAKCTTIFEKEQITNRDALHITCLYRLIRAFGMCLEKDDAEESLRGAIVTIAKKCVTENAIKLLKGDLIEILSCTITTLSNWSDNTEEEEELQRSIPIAQAKAINDEVETHGRWKANLKISWKLASVFHIYHDKGVEEKSLRKATSNIAKSVVSRLQQQNFTLPEKLTVKYITAFSKWHELDDEEQSIRNALLALAECLNNDFQSGKLTFYKADNLARLSKDISKWRNNDHEHKFRTTITNIARTICTICQTRLLPNNCLHCLATSVTAFSEFYSLDDCHVIELKKVALVIAETVPNLQIFISHDIFYKDAMLISKLMNALSIFRKDHKLPAHFNEPVKFISKKIFEEYERNKLECYSVQCLCWYISSFSRWHEAKEEPALRRTVLAIAKVFTLRYQNAKPPEIDKHLIPGFTTSFSVWYGYDDLDFSLRKTIKTIADIIMFHYDSGLFLDYSINDLRMMASALLHWIGPNTISDPSISTAMRLIQEYIEEHIHCNDTQRGIEK